MTSCRPLFSAGSLLDVTIAYNIAGFSGNGKDAYNSLGTS